MKKMKIKIFGRDSINWSITNDRKNTQLFLSLIEEVELTENSFLADVYFFVWYAIIIPKRILLLILKTVLRKKVIAVITNNIREYEREFNKLKNIVDIWISPSSKISDFLFKKNVKFFQIPFYVSPEDFYFLKENKRELLKRLNIDFDKINNKMLIGSFQKDSLGSDLGSAKWQKGPDILLEICQKMDKDFVLILAGPRRHYIVNKCREYKIPYLFVGDERYIDRGEDDIFVNNLDSKKINILFNIIDFYIVSSVSEGGPKAIMEAALSNTLILSTDVGLAKDFLHKDLIYDKADIDKVSNFICNLSDDNMAKYVKYNRDNALKVFSKDNFLFLYKKLIELIKQ